MAATVTIDKVYFETLLRRYAQLSPYPQLWTNKWYCRAEFVRHLYEADWLPERSLFTSIAYIWQRSDDSR